MKRSLNWTILAAALLLALATGGGVTAAEPLFSPERFKAHVTFLADDLLEGREAGTRGHEIAARYIAAQFALLGVKPGAGNGSYFDSVELFESAVTGPAPTVTLTTPRGSQVLTNGGAAIVRRAPGDGRVSVKAPIVFAGYGMRDARFGLDDYKGLDVRGKIVLVLSGAPKGMDSEVGAHLLSEQGRVAAEHGAAALLSVHTRATAAAFPWEQVVAFASRPQTTWVRKDGTPSLGSGGPPAGALLQQDAAAALLEGAPKSLDQILAEADAAGGRPKGFPLEATAEITIETAARRYSSPNVIGIIEGSDPNLKHEYVTLMGHADHIGVRSVASGDRTNNGALDNAGGIATLLEVARALTAAAERPRRSILLVATTAEEKALLGAERLAHAPPVAVDRIVAAINLDMPMLLYDFTDVVAFGARHSTLQDAFEEAANAIGVKLSPDPMPEQAVFVRSDHYALVKAGIPAAMLATGMENGGAEAWRTFFASAYHQPSDDLSQPIVWKAGARFAEFNYRAVRALADHEARPRWYADSYFGEQFAPKAPKAAKRTQ